MTAMLGLLLALLATTSQAMPPEHETAPVPNVGPTPVWKRRSAEERPPDAQMMWGGNGQVQYGTDSSPRRANPTATNPRPASFQLSSSYSNLRIHVVYGGHEVASTADWSWLQSTLIPATLGYFEEMLKVVPVSGTMYVPRQCTTYYTSSGKCASKTADADETCGTDYGTVPAANLGAISTYSGSGDETVTPAGAGGYDGADYILYVTAKTGHCGANTLAYAGACRFDQYDRPVVGYANFCPTAVDSSASAWDSQYSTAIHEIFHALGFSASRFSYFWDHATGTPRTPRCSQIDPAPSGYSCAGDTTDWQAASNYLSGYPGDSAGSPTRKPATTTLNSFTERDETVWKMVTAAALSEARTHFGCSSLNGVEVENGGGSGTAGSHWEQRIFGNEMMTGVDSVGPVVSNITLAYMYDSGWYLVDYSKTSVLLWGKNAGCSFATAKCLTAGNPPVVVSGGSEFFCTSASTNGCNAVGLGYGACNVGTSISSIPSSMQYFTSSTTKGGNSVTRDYCPYVQAYSNRDCRFAANAPSNLYGETFASSSRCLASSLAKTGNSNSNNAGCFPYTCDSGTSTLSIFVVCPTGQSGCTSQYVSCPTGGAAGTATPPASMGLSGSITCPTYTSFCDRGWTGLGPEGGITPTVAPTPAPASTTTKSTITIVAAFSTVLDDGHINTVKATHLTELESIFPQATWTNHVALARRTTSLSLSGTGTGTVSTTALSSAESSFTTGLSSALSTAGFSGVALSGYSYTVDAGSSSSDDTPFYYYIIGGTVAVLLVVLFVCCLCRFCSSCPWSKRLNREKQDMETRDVSLSMQLPPVQVSRPILAQYVRSPDPAAPAPMYVDQTVIVAPSQPKQATWQSQQIQQGHIVPKPDTLQQHDDMRLARALQEAEYAAYENRPIPIG